MAADRFTTHLQAKLANDFDNNDAQDLLSTYGHTKSRLEQDLYENIRGAEPHLTDHGRTHIANVHDNVLALLSDNDTITDLSGIELYCLGMLILFHDTGNVYGRHDHQNNVASVFDRIRGTSALARREKTLIVRAARAHTGTSHDGSRDTLKDVGETENLRGRPVRLRQLAAILRFADELAEGPQRTSDFMRTQNRYDEQSVIHHEYAAITHVLIDRAIGRVVMTYEIDLKAADNTETRTTFLRSLLTFVYHRLTKVDQERQYARHYSSLLDRFKSTEATFNFHCGDRVLDVDILPLKLTDPIVIPGSHAARIPTLDPTYAVDNLVPRLISECPGAAP